MQLACGGYQLDWCGICHGGEYNSEQSYFDGGDCQECNQVVVNPSLVGDGICHGGEYYSEQCYFDGGDCQECNQVVVNPSLVGDGICHGGEYNTEP